MHSGSLPRLQGSLEQFHRLVSKFVLKQDYTTLGRFGAPTITESYSRRDIGHLSNVPWAYPLNDSLQNISVGHAVRVVEAGGVYEIECHALGGSGAVCFHGLGVRDQSVARWCSCARYAVIDKLRPQRR